MGSGGNEAGGASDLAGLLQTVEKDSEELGRRAQITSGMMRKGWILTRDLSAFTSSI